MTRRIRSSSYYFSGFKELSETTRLAVLGSITTFVLLAGGCVAQHQMTTKQEAPPNAAFAEHLGWDWRYSCETTEELCWAIDVQTTEGCPLGVHASMDIVSMTGLVFGHAEDTVGPLLVGQKAHMEFTPSSPLAARAPGTDYNAHLTSVACVQGVAGQ